jgi:hypothetical protein
VQPDTDVTTTSTTEPTGPVAEIEPLTGGNGPFVATPGGPDLAAVGWIEEEFAASGTAVSYASDGDLPTDGTFDLHQDQTADYRTRVIVRRPGQTDDFNGTVVIEWLNISGGVDAAPDYTYLADELVRAGYAWVGVSAQLIGVEGGDVLVPVDAGAGIAGRGLKSLDPERYADLSHPGDAFAYDIFTQVGRAARAGTLLGDLEATTVIAAGESQSAFMLTTYANGVQPLTGAFDGFLIHSRGAAAAPLGEAGAGIDFARALGGPPTRIRTDLDVPVLVLETETDVTSILGYAAARQPDSDLLRVWEIAGTAHADAYVLGPMAGSLGCAQPINAGPLHYVAKAALRHLDAWAQGGGEPPSAEPLAVGADGALVRDADGIATGGIRTPPVEVPVVVLSGDPAPGGSIVCLLMGTTTPMPPERLVALYPEVGSYLAAYEAATAEAIDAGFVLDDDREALLADADPGAIPL